MPRTEWTEYQVGDQVICNGYQGVIKTVCDGQLKGMVEVKLRSGVVCTSAKDIGLWKVEVPREPGR